ncbi:MAG: methionine synthase [Bacteroidaceae bacterium]|nr:methionine synthase [Bacteroidaceae bacterium]
MTLHEAIQHNILILDGAMGTMLQRKGFKGNFDQLNLTHPEVVQEVHRLYLEAGADILSTNTFSSQRISQAEYHCENKIRELNTEGVRIARRLADEFTKANPSKPRFVAGSVGPTNRTCSMSPDVNDPARRDITFDQLEGAYEEQMTAMIEAGVDALLIETIFDTLNAKAALYAAEEAMKNAGRKVEVMLSMTVSDKAGRTLSGQTIEAFLISVSHADIFSVGLNCSFGAKDLKPFLRELASKAPYYISCHPNAGLPNAMGTYDQTATEFAEQVMEFVDEGLVNIVGGCCGTTPDFIRALSDSVERFSRSTHQAGNLNPEAHTFALAGLEPLLLTPEVHFINIGERCNVAGSRKFLRLINEKNYDEALQIARKQVEDGAMVLDINMDDGLLNAKAEMTHFVNLLMSDPDIARIPLMIDSSDWDVITAGLKCIQGKSIVNSLSLKEGETTFLSKAREVKRLGAALVVMAFDEEGQATTYEQKINVCQRAYDLLLSIGFNPSDIIFDPCVLAVGTGIEAHNNYALDFIRATEWIKQNLPHAHVSGGVSNLSFSFRGNNYLREAMHAVFLYHNIQKGMDMAIVNPASKVTYADIDEEFLTAIDDVLLNRRDDATERLILIGQNQNAQSNVDTPQEQTVHTLGEMIMKGMTENLETIVLDELKKQESAVKVIEGPLMEAMNRVGELFGEGKMFLPQVVKTARTMKQAVNILQPYFDTHSSDTSDNNTHHVVLLATVKGDVHDIGKNIVGVVMGCNGYEIVDMGVMVSAEDIVKKAKEINAEIIGLSGLITPSLTEMVNTAHALREAGISVPLMIGGATTSDMHTALKIAIEYDGPVVWMKDAAQNVVAAQHLLDPNDKANYIEQLQTHQAELRESYEQNQPELLSLEEARKRKPKYE